MTALEEYTAHHAERAKDIMHNWSWRLFEGMFKRHLLRKAREELREMRDLRIAAMDANTNWDAKENANAREQRIEALNKAFVDAINTVYSSTAPQPEEMMEEDDPLFAPIRRRAAQAHGEINQPLVKEAGMGRQLVS